MSDDRAAADDHGAWRAFLGGAMRPSPVALFGALGVALLLLATAALVGAPRLLEQVDAGYLMVDGSDRDVVLMQRTLQLCRSAPGPCTVALVGDSALQCGLSVREDLATRLSSQLRDCGRPCAVDVRLLMTFGMTLAQRCAVVDRVGAHATGALLIAVDPELPSRTITEGPRDLPFARDVLESPALEEEYRLAGHLLPPASGLFVVDHYAFLAPRMLLGLQRSLGRPLKVPFSPRATRFLPEARMQEELALDATRYNLMLDRSGDRRPGLEILGRMIQRLRERSAAPVVLLESPRHPLLRAALQRGGEPWFDRYSRGMQKFAAAHQVEYWCIDAEAGLGGADFGDPLHIASDEARERFTDRLLQRLAALLAGDGPGSK